jgi:predicted N-formylglutamate amidohydrolase
MIAPAEFIPGQSASRVLLIADHASNRVPDDVILGAAPALLNDHIALDIGVAPLTRVLAERLGAAAVLARFSRLVVDLNRDADEENVIPAMSDGHVIPGNRNLSAAGREERLARYWYPYHALVDERIETLQPALLGSVHSFTPRLSSRPEEERPWQVGVLYNRDERAARIAIPMLRERGVVTGDNEPYSGRALNATMNRHGEGRSLPYLGLEVRQDLIATGEGVAQWADQLAPVIREVAAALA